MSAGRVLRGAASPGLLGALVLPLAAMGGAVAAGWVSGPELLGARSLLAWLALLFLALTARGFAAYRDGRHGGAALAWIGALLVAQGWYSVAAAYDLRMDAGEGEEAPGVEVAFAGRAARPPAVRALVLPGRRDGIARLDVAGRILEAQVGLETPVGNGVVVLVEAVHAAPSFVVRRADGVDVDAAFLKIWPGRREYFEAGWLPHRFYVEMGPGPLEGEVGVPERIRLVVQRGKIRSFDGELRRGEPLRLEGLSVSYAAGARWARIRVRHLPRPWLAGAAAIVAVVAIASRVRQWWA